MQKFKEILIIDDEATSQLINRVVIKKMAITERIVVKADGFQALTYLREMSVPVDTLAADQFPDLIFLDIHMPIINGFNFLEALKDLNWEPIIRSRVIVLTWSTNEEDVEKAAAYGVKGYIVKPLTREKLISMLGRDIASQGNDESDQS